MNPLVSIIITTKNEGKVLKKLLHSIQKQQYKNYEIVIVDNNSQDNTKIIAKRFNTRILNRGPERSAQRNYGVRKSKGKFLLFLDADMTITRNVIKECVETLGKERKIGGLVIPEVSVAESFWERIKKFERSFYNLEGDRITDAARFFVKRVFLKCKGYDEEITGPEDWDITDSVRNVGFGIKRIKAKIYHQERVPSLLSLMGKKFYYGLDAHRYIKKHHISTFSSKTIYFLRPVFYKNIDKIFLHPVLSAGLLVMLTCELLAGSIGYLIGRVGK